MKKLMMITAAACAVAMMSGCSSPAKMRDIGLKGMYVNGYSEVLAIGAGRLTSIPGEREAMAAHYREDTAWLQPSIKTHELDLFLVGSNTVLNADKIIEHVCKAFADVAPGIAATDAEVSKSGGTAPLDVIKAGGEVRKDVKSAKAAAETVKTASPDVTQVAESASEKCTGSECVYVDK